MLTPAALFRKKIVKDEGIDVLVNHGMDLLNNPVLSFGLRRREVYVAPLHYEKQVYILIDNQKSLSQFDNYEAFCLHGRKLFDSFRNPELEYYLC